ncbi:MAG: HAD family hydrolase [Bacteroidales bacterium]|nr:HAD family hydrolase [Bacteroidales bacterium]
MNKAVFLDRDGVINNGDLYYTYRLEDFHFNPDVFEALQLLSQNGYLLIIITNQGGIAKGEYTKADVDEIHNWMKAQIANHNATIEEVYYCPHHDSLEACLCRKPESGMIEKAIARFEIDPQRSFFIGDGERDIKAGEKAGLRSIKTNKNQSILSICQSIVEGKI